MSHDPLVWSLSEIAASIDEDSPGSQFFIQVPKFQRSIVWTDSQIKKLVDSIYNGFPIGSLLAYRTAEVRVGKPILQLVDGLQRVTAISRFIAAPLKYAPTDVLVNEDYLRLCAEQIFGDHSERSLLTTKHRFMAWFETQNEASYGGTFTFAHLARHLSDGNPEALARLVNANLESGAGDDLLAKVLKDLEVVRNYRVPINVYSGPIEDVPTIFERINSQGAKLSKYEILAASWSNTSVDVQNKEVIQAIAEKYQVMIANGYEVDGFDEGSVESSEYNLYEYLFGLGKVLAQKFPTLFHSSESADDDSPVAFQIFTVALKLPVAKMGTLAEKMPRDESHAINVSSMEKAVFFACDLAENALAQYLTLTLNETTRAPSGVGQNQAISMVTAVLANCFDDNFGSHQPNFAKDIANNIPAHFLLDILRNAWGNAGDTTLFTRTWQQVELPESEVGKTPPRLVPSDHYLRPVGAGSLRTAFELWHSTQLGLKHTQRARYAKDAKPVLKFIYSTLLTPQEEKGVTFELEHVYPVAVLKKLIADANIDGLPMSAIGNLMLLPKEINRIKKEVLLGDYVLKTPKVDLPDQELKRLQSFLIAPELTDVSLENGINPDKFQAFCELRASAMVDHLIDSLALGGAESEGI